jgi:CheY-like chemotaxis protein
VLSRVRNSMNALNRQREHLREPGLDLRPWRLDLILLDYFMPKVNGLRRGRAAES